MSPMKEPIETGAAAMEIEGDMVEEKATDSPADDKTMYDATEETSQENKASSASNSAEAEEVNMEQERTDMADKMVNVEKKDHLRQRQQGKHGGGGRDVT